jgi:chromosomal replication initiator protein
MYMEQTCVGVWQNCLSVIRDNISYQSFKTWFEPITPVGLHEHVLTIQVPSQFFYEWLEEHYITLLRKTIKKELGPEGRLEYSIIMDSNGGSNGKDERFSINIPATNKKATQNAYVSMPIDLNRDNAKEIPNPFIIPGLKKSRSILS